MEKEYYVYVVFREDNNEPFYVGKGKNYRYLVSHKRNKKCEEIKEKFGAYSKILKNNLTEEEAFKLEQETIISYSEKYNLTNVTKGGGRGNPNYKHSEETKRKIAERTKRQWSDKETRERLVNGMNGIKQDKKPKERKKRGPMSEEQKQKLREGIKNSKLKKSRIEKISKYKNVHVYDLENNLVGVFINTRDAVDYIEMNFGLEIKMPNVIDVIKGRRKTCKGFIWKSIGN